MKNEQSRRVNDTLNQDSIDMSNVERDNVTRRGSKTKKIMKTKSVFAQSNDHDKYSSSPPTNRDLSPTEEKK